MSNDLMLDVGQAVELKAAFRRAGFNNAQIKRLCEGDIMSQVKLLVCDKEEIQQAIKTINCSLEPSIPGGWHIRSEDQLPGRVTEPNLIWDPTRACFWLSDKQTEGGVSTIKELIFKLKNEPVLPVNVLDFLLANPHLIPNEWKQDKQGRIRYTYFWGTIYRDMNYDLCVRCLHWRDNQWRTGYGWRGVTWNEQTPAATYTA